MKEIKYDKILQSDEQVTENICPSCQSNLIYGQIPCPEQKPGCLVVHYGYKCPKCGKIYQ